MKLRLVVTAALLGLVILLSSCSVPNPLTRGPELPQAVNKAAEVLSEDLGVSSDVVQLVAMSQEQWPNACLDLPQPGESCDPATTPGWRITFSVYGQLHIYRSDLGGSVVRAEQGGQ